MQGNPMADRAAFTIRRDNVHLVPGGKGVVQCPQSRRVDTIIIGQQYSHLIPAFIRTIAW